MLFFVFFRNMQQAVASSQAITLTTPTSLLATVSQLNRNVIRLRLSKLASYLRDKHVQVTAAFASTLTANKNVSQPTIKNKQTQTTQAAAVDDLVDSLLTKLTLDYRTSSSPSMVLDPLVRPMVDLNNTFFENKFGFSERDLLQSNAQYEHLSFVKQPKGLLSLSSTVGLNYQQTRGFKTRRQQAETEHEPGLANMFNIKNLYQSGQKSSPASSSVASDENLLKTFNNLISKTGQSGSKGAQLGSIFDSTSTATTDAKRLNGNNTDLENKLKIAFVEGFLYRQSKDDKHSKRITNLNLLFRFFLIMLIIFLVFSSISITTVSNGNGKNGSSSGINIRALTGNMNFEVSPETVHVKFDDVKGMPEAKKELVEIVDFLKDPEKYTKLGARLPKGVLLVGPPGCGKTLLAKAVAGEAGVPFFQASGSDFDEMFVGTGSKRVRQLFSAARARSPCVIFIDEIDSVGSTRTNSMIHPHANQTINQLLAEMDGFQKNEGVIVLGATNRRDTLDSALMRPGRFDVEVKIDKPDLSARIEILEYYLDKIARDENIDVKYLARQLTGLGGSSIENVVNQSALRAVVMNSKTVKMEHLEWALDRTLMGYGKSRLMDEECNRNTAYHEAGHVLVAYYTKDSDPLHKVTILPRCIKYFLYYIILFIFIP